MLKYGGTLYLKLPVPSHLDSSSLHSGQTVCLLLVTLPVSWDSLCFLILCLYKQFLLLSCRPQASHLNRLHEIAAVKEGMNRHPACEDGTLCADEGFSKGDGWWLVALVERRLVVLPAWGGAGVLFSWWGLSNGRFLVTGGVIHRTRNSCLSRLWRRSVLAWWRRLFTGRLLITCCLGWARSSFTFSLWCWLFRIQRQPQIFVGVDGHVMAKAKGVIIPGRKIITPVGLQTNIIHIYTALSKPTHQDSSQIIWMLGWQFKVDCLFFLWVNEVLEEGFV